MKPILSAVVVFTLSASATSVLAARGESPALHRDGRCIARRMQLDFHHGLLARNTMGAGIQAGKSAADGVYTEAQSTRGQGLYDKMCASCHGEKLDGTAMAPTLSGQDFISGWSDKTAADLNEKIQTTMPADAAGSLMPEQTVDLIAYLLKVNNYPAGSTELAPGAGLAGIGLKAK